MPARALLARRPGKSVDTIDRALRELSTANIVRIEHPHHGHHYKSNRYHLRTTDPCKPATMPTSPATTPTTAPATGGNRKNAATPTPGTTASTQTSRTDTGTPGRRSAARVAAKLRHYPEVPTQTRPPPPPGREQAGPPRVGGVNLGNRRPSRTSLSAALAARAGVSPAAR